jgi:protein phosphatase
MIVVHLAARTDRGILRQDNQDSLLALHVGSSELARLGTPEASRASVDGGEALLLAVCDGMGGAAGGALASACAVETLEAEAHALASVGDALARHVSDAIVSASQRILSEARRNKALSGMGTTATVAAVSGTQLVLGQVGDSRAYLLRHGKLTQLTRDQNLATILVERGQLTPEAARHYENSNIILQALGTQETVDVDLSAVELSSGDVLLLCSDGLWGPVDDEDIARVLRSTLDCGAATAALIALAIEKGAPDNVTCIVARFEGSTLMHPAGDGPPRPEKVALAPAVPSPDDTQPISRVDARADEPEVPRSLVRPTVALAALAAAVLCGLVTVACSLTALFCSYGP